MPQRPRSTGLPIVRQVVVDVEPARRDDVRPSTTSRLIGDAAVVLPLVGIADLRVERRELLERAAAWSPALIQSSPWIVSRMAASRFLTISCMRALASGGKYFSTYFLPSASPSSSSVDSTQRFQRGFISVAPARYAAVEREVLVDERLRQRRRGRVEQVPLEVGLPVGDRRRRAAGGRLLDELRLARR